MEMNELLRQAKTGMNVTNIMLGKRNQMQDRSHFQIPIGVGATPPVTSGIPLSLLA